jgi:hypothetical protein
MSDADWRYHLTSRTIAQIIKTAGISSNLSRIGIPVAAPKGAFNQDRLSKEADKQQAKLVQYLAEFMARGTSADVLSKNNKLFVPLAFTPVGNNAVDTPKLTQLEKQSLATFAQSLHGLGPDNWRKAKELRGKKETTQLADKLLRSNKNHYLARLAVQIVSFTYKIEETISSSHIYFFLPKYADACYRDYTKHLNTNDLVMLRVHKDNITRAVQDDSEFRAVMTRNKIGPEVIEVMSQINQFTNLAARCNDANWVAIRNWV